ncbi:MAG: hypothetical protein ABSH03_06270 [Candidatus Lustribacter sp.]
MSAGLKEPVLGYDVPLEGPNGWHEANRYLLWTGHFALDAPPVALQERIDGRTETLPLRKRSLSLVPAGTPHRLTHLAGFWRTSDADFLVLRAELPEAVYVSLYVSSGPLHHTDRLFWICPACGTELAPWVYDVGRYGALAFWERLREPVRAFNADPVARTCPGCGAVHPTAYAWDAEEDTPEERLARAAW